MEFQKQGKSNNQAKQNKMEQLLKLTKMEHIMLIHHYMIEYQKANNITRQCLTNSQYLYDCLTKNKVGKKVVAKAVIVITWNYADEGENIKNWNIVSNHMVIVLTTEENKEMVIECSHEIASMENKMYYDNVKSLMENCSDKESKKKIMENLNLEAFVDFIKTAEMMNNDKLVIACEKNYEAQADYVHEEMRKLKECPSVY